jgi:hypothetical protein
MTYSSSVDIEPVVAALLAELQRQAQGFPADGPFVGPTDIPTDVHVDGLIDVQALAAAVVLAAPPAPLN